MVDAYVSHWHLFDHVQPIWDALGSERGTLYVGPRALRRQLATDGYEAHPGRPDQPGPPVLVANHQDYTQTHPKRPVVYLEHGAGQTYRDQPGHPAYSGGTHRERVALFLTLNDLTAARERLAYPHARVVVVGSPRLDRLAALPRVTAGKPKPVVAFCWHWDANLVPETRTAWPHFRREVAELARSDRVQVLGHGHPRAWPQLARDYERMGVEAVRSFAEVVRRADLVCVDNTSAGPEAAACGLPVLWLTSPAWRADCDHGGRFWQWPRGQVTARPGELAGAVVEALGDAQSVQRARQQMVDRIYPPWTRGQAAALAVGAIRRLANPVAVC